MIAFLKGRLAEKEPTFVIIDVNGVGYHVNISLQTYSKIKEEESCKLHTYLHVKEDAQTLFGFTASGEKSLFLHLISINGVGPSTALMVLSSLSPKEIQEAIIHGDVATIQRVKGIGAKTAQRIILELKDKLQKDTGLVIEGGDSAGSGHNTVKEEALQALITLGFNKATADKSIDRILRKEGTDLPLEDLIRIALKSA